MTAPPVILASQSAIRRKLLENAGLAVETLPARVDEDEIKLALRAAGASVEDAAIKLAEAKARRVAERIPGALVIGCDQMLECNGVWFDKPPDRAHAAAHLRALSGKTHRLISAVVAYRNMVRVWHHVDAAKLSVRPLSDAFIATYLDQVGEAALSSVGAYQLEGLGAQLFTRIEGDYFTVLGLPLLPLLGFLRANGVVAE
ncbi:MAG: septum formation protein Maf [Azospirillum sp.]|nr:septum formation protein Maf [Azospirillum sp.]MCA3265069.1 septum formation protein Maf [Azospirillum sp.]MCZ8121806.1 Maf family nucleotide pyrophosphatase [Magnetospirillum sp.]